MIPAVEALQLPTAQLSADEVAAADQVEAMIEEYVKKRMTRQGTVIEVKETRGDIIADVGQRLKAAGYQVQWAPMVEQNAFHKNTQTLVGFRLSLAPSDESYRTAARAILS